MKSLKHFGKSFEILKIFVFILEILGDLGEEFVNGIPNVPVAIGSGGPVCFLYVVNCARLPMVMVAELRQLLDKELESDRDGMSLACMYVYICTRLLQCSL